MHSLASTVSFEPPARLPDLPDMEAIAAVNRGHREMFEVIVRRYNPQLYRVGMAYLRNHAQTEDAMQNAYLKAFLNLAKFRGASSFGTWLTRIMINECLSFLRQQKRFSTEPLTEECARLHTLSFATPSEDPIHNQEMKSMLEEAIQALPRSHRAVYLLREVQRLSTAETARCLHLSPENVKVILHRARERLRNHLFKSAAGVEVFPYTAVYCDPLTTRVMQAVTAADTSVNGKE